MKFNVVEVYSDYIGGGGNIYDCWAKDVWQLTFDKNGKIVWSKLRTKTNKCYDNPKADICFGGAYGLMAIRRECFFKFDQSDIDALNKIKKDDILAKNSLIKKLQKQLQEFITKQIKKLDCSGTALISSAYPSYPTHESGIFGADEKRPYLAETKFGIAISQWKNKKEGLAFLGEPPLSSEGGWHPGLVIS